ncbi:OLC1v1022482C2 [Oldenlandia corymbosa var. corymbosa]|nr:OLC1v1022482C2 [Oldenlandia corymbosa var. corymbosa]
MKLDRVADILFTERLKNNIAEWLDRLLREGNSGRLETENRSKASSQKMKTIFFKMHPAIDLSGFTLHQLRLIQLIVKKHFKDLVFVSVTNEASCQQHLIVYTESRSDQDLLLREVKDCIRKESEMKIKGAIGFRQVIDLLSSEKKLIVGHNSFLDVAHVYRKFIGPLPSTAKNFVAAVQKYFPFIIDTKVMLNTNSVLETLLKRSSRNTSLSKAFALLCPQIASVEKPSGSDDKYLVKVEVQVDDKRSQNWNSGAKHEAGYDAFMTGCVFAQACSYLCVDFNCHPPSSSWPHNEKLQGYVNHLYLSWINGDIIDLRSGNCKPELTSSRNWKNRCAQILYQNMVVLWGFPSKLKASEIRECFSKAFGSTSVSMIYYLDKTAVFIQFSKEELVSEFLVLKKTLERSNDPISVIHPLSKVLEGGQTCAGNYEAYKSICSSSISKVFFADQADAVGIQWKTQSLGPVPEDEMVPNKNKVLPDSPYQTENVEEVLSNGNNYRDELDSFFPAQAAQLRSR